MEIGIVTTAYNGYSRFIPQWLNAIAELSTKPKAVTIVRAVDEIYTEEVSQAIYDFEKKTNILPLLLVSRGPKLMGPMRNAAVKPTKTEWIMYLSVDDVILPGAIDELARYEKDADYICIKWLSRATWNPRAKVMVHNPKTPEEMMIKYNGRGFIVGHSPFRRKFWEKHPYKPHDYPNAPFVADMVEAGARFAKTEEPCTMYLRRIGSHAQRLVTRGGVDERDPAEKRLANRWKNNMQKRIRKYYRKKWEKDRVKQEK